MNIGPFGTDVHVIGLGLDFGLGCGLVIGLGIALGIAIGIAFGLGIYLRHVGRREHMGRSSRPTIALALEPSSKKNISQVRRRLHTC